MINLKKEIKEEESFFKNIFRRFKKKDFSGDGGQAIKNSSYQLAQNLIFKIGSLIFTIILARMLLPEKMGLYSLALSTILIIAAFSDLGIGQALMTFVPKNLKKNPNKAKGYYKKLLKWKLVLLLTTTIITVPAAWLISKFIYPDKPIFFALLAGVLYIPIVSFAGFIEQSFKATNNFKTPLIKEIFFQILRFIVAPLAILLTLDLGFSNQRVIFAVLISIIGAYAFGLLFMLSRQKHKSSFIKESSKNLNKKEITDLKKFILPLFATATAGVFFGYVDTIMLGHFLKETIFVGYYSVAFNLVAGVSTIISFMAVSMMPIFAKESGKVLEKMLSKSKKIVVLISALASIVTYIISDFAIKTLYTTEYLPSVNILKLFSILILILPTISLYTSYFTSQKKTKTLSWLIFTSSILNIILNFFGITYGLNNFGEMGAVYGACIATIISRFVYLFGLGFLRKR